MSENETISIESSPQVVVRGESTLNRRPPTLIRVMAIFCDLSLALGLFSVVSLWLNQSVLPSFSTIIVFGALLLALTVVQHVSLGATVGELAWQLERKIRIDGVWKEMRYQTLKNRPTAYFQSEVFQQGYLQARPIGTGILLTITIFSSAIGAAREVYWKHPALLTASVEPLTGLTDEEANDAEAQFILLPAFYSLGLWPREFEAKPVFYQLPYAKGPPLQFIPKIVAKWDAGNIAVELEGPKTPAKAPPRELLKHCLTHDWFVSQDSPAFNQSCLEIRDQSLSRHIRELRALTHARNWQISWFEVKNTEYPESEQPQGVHLTAVGAHTYAERYIAITARGTHQSFNLISNRLDQSKDKASRLLSQSVRSLRVSDELNTGKTFIDQQLGSTNLSEIESETDPRKFALQLLSVQAFLMGRISVDPSSIESFYHLAGTVSLMVNRAKVLQNSEWTSTAKPLLRNITAYIKDLKSTTADPVRAEAIEKQLEMLQITIEK